MFKRKEIKNIKKKNQKHLIIFFLSFWVKK